MWDAIWAFLCTRAGTTLVQVALALVAGAGIGWCIAERVKEGWR